jgi:sialate O-acetylesterase
MSREALESYPKIIKDGEQYADTAKREEIIQGTTYSILEWETNNRQEDIGFALGWQKPETNIDDWKEMILLGDFATAAVKPDDELKNFCGVIWLAKDFEVSADFAKDNAQVWLGTIVDADTVYLNGEEIGNTGYRYPPRKYAANSRLKPGKNRIVIRVTCNSGQGEITPEKPFLIFTDNESIELSGTWKYNIGVASTTRPSEFFFQWQPMGNYNAMIAPVLKYPLKGVIWYQGESNESRPHEYAGLFQKMVLDWRKKNNNDKLPFLFVQLPIFLEPSDNNENHNWALIREAQASALSLPFTGMAAAWEYGESNDIHPLNKKDIGYRLYLAAEKLLFGTGNTSPGPMVKKHEMKDKKLYIYFDNCGTGLNFSSHEGAENTEGFISVITDEKQIRLPVVIESLDCISIDLSNIKNPKKILYAWANNPKDRQLYNKEGLPCIPFRIVF